jgi:hypothetical protein
MLVPEPGPTLPELSFLPKLTARALEAAWREPGAAFLAAPLSREPAVDFPVAILDTSSMMVVYETSRHLPECDQAGHAYQGFRLCYPSAYKCGGALKL